MTSDQTTRMKRKMKANLALLAVLLLPFLLSAQTDIGIKSLSNPVIPSVLEPRMWKQSFRISVPTRFSPR
jgi:hypothetical protein